MIKQDDFPKFLTSSFVYFTLVLTLVLLGLMFMYSASYHEAINFELPHYYFLKNQIKICNFSIACFNFYKINQL